MTAQRHETILPTDADRIAADRAVRLAHEHGAVEVARFFAELSPRQQPVVFALMARSSLSRPPGAGQDPSPWWTAQELRDAHRLWASGRRDAWVIQGHRLYLSANTRARRALQVAR